MSGKALIEQRFSVPFRHLQFHFGGVSCKKRIEALNKKVPITIINYNIREEFDAVKDYFANALGTTAIQITVRIDVANGQPRAVEATSPEIDSINTSLIETVRFRYVKEAVRKKGRLEAGKNLLTMDEFFETLSEEAFNPAAFYTQESELAEDLLAITETRHYQHLRFLSSVHIHAVMRLRFVLQPFSFLFLLEGREQYHLVWETLDTEEATYVWPVAKEVDKVKMALQMVEDILQLVKVQGKTAYLTSDETCSRIFHHYKEGIRGFIKWKNELESRLT